MIEILSKKFTPMLKIVYKFPMTKPKKISTNPPLAIFRQNFTPRTEEQLNVQIGQELNASQAYLAMSNFFGRTEIALNGMSSFFRAMSSEEREHALQLIDYQNMRGGRVKMEGCLKPKDEFINLISAVEESLLIERANVMALMELVHVAEKDGDILTVDYITSKFLNEQVCHFVDCRMQGMKKFFCVEQMNALQSLGNILTRLKHFEQKGIGEYFIDQEFQKKYSRESELLKN